MIVIVDYGVGNVGSVRNMLKFIGVDSIVARDEFDIATAEKLILPGVGAFDRGMAMLRQKDLVPVLTRKVLLEHTPLLGICLGMQLLTRSSQEGTTSGLGWIPGVARRFQFGPGPTNLKVPHMGWAVTKAKRKDALIGGLDQARFYFVHSYHVVCDSPDDVLLTAVHGHEFTAAVRRNNIYGVQFHPEKSHKFGMTLFKNFAAIV